MGTSFRIYKSILRLRLGCPIKSHSGSKKITSTQKTQSSLYLEIKLCIKKQNCPDHFQALSLISSQFRDVCALGTIWYSSIICVFMELESHVTCNIIKYQICLTQQQNKQVPMLNMNKNFLSQYPMLGQAIKIFYYQGPQVLLGGPLDSALNPDPDPETFLPFFFKRT